MPESTLSTIPANDFNTIQRNNADPFFVAGDDRVSVESGEVIGIAVSVAFTLRDGAERPSKGHSVVIHEIPLLRRAYPTGTITLETGWAPAVKRERELKMGRFDQEIMRLRRSYMMRDQNILAEVFGPTEAEQKVSIHKAMLKVATEWRKVWARCLSAAKKQIGIERWDVLHRVHRENNANRFLTMEDLESLVQLVEPLSNGLASVSLPAINLDANTDVGDNETDSPVGELNDSALVKALLAKKIDRVTALEIEAIHNEIGSAIDEEIMAEVKGMQKADGKLNLKMAQTVRLILAAFVPKE